MNIFITGGNKGIGRALTVKFAENANNVIFTYNTGYESAIEICENYPNVECHQCDLREYDRCIEIGVFVKQKYNKIDVLINNAGYDKDTKFLNMNKNVWDDVIDVNLNSIFNFTKLFIPEMLESNWGRIINLTSIAGFTGAFGKSNYSAAKAGVVGFTKSIAQEFASKGITVNAIAPGAIETDMFFRIPEKYRDKILENIPAKRFGQAEEVADLAYFLSSNNASYINGQTIHINGGSYM